MNHPNRLRFTLSLRFLLAAVTVIFVIGYQQHQIRQLRTDVTELRQANEEVTRKLQQGSVRIITANRNTLGGQGPLYFPIEVERAMMGDSIQMGNPPGPLRVR